MYNNAATDGRCKGTHGLCHCPMPGSDEWNSAACSSFVDSAVLPTSMSCLGGLRAPVQTVHSANTSVHETQGGAWGALSTVCTRNEAMWPLGQTKVV